MAHTVFYSWQADAPNNVCRNFIEEALKRAIKQLAQDLTVEEAIRDGLQVDKDMQGVAGTPPIVETIFRKIDAAAIYVVDLTFVGTRLDGRPTPNPNVLVEYGWALKSLGTPKIICVMNTAYGAPDHQTLPFNMRHLQWPLRYNLPATADGAAKAATLAELVGHLKSKLRDILQSEEFRASIPLPPEPQKYQPVAPVNGPARFRKRDQLIGVIDPMLSGDGIDVRLTGEPSLWLRLMPVFAPPRQWSIPELRQAISQTGSLITLGYFGSWTSVRGSDGFGCVPTPLSGAIDVTAVSFTFKGGEIWNIYTGRLTTPIEGTFRNIEAELTECLMRSVRFMSEGLKIAPPYTWIAGIQGIKGKRMQRIRPPGQCYIEDLTAQSLEDAVSATGVLGQTDKPQWGLRPFFRNLYDACGEQRSDYMDQALLNIQIR